MPEATFGCSFVVDPFKPEEIAVACDRLFRDTELAQEMGNRGIARLQQVYNREVWLDKIRGVSASVAFSWDQDKALTFRCGSGMLRLRRNIPLLFYKKRNLNSLF